MRNSEARRKLIEAGFKIKRTTGDYDFYEHTQVPDLRCSVARRDTARENPQTTREVEMMIRRVDSWKNTRSLRTFEKTQTQQHPKPLTAKIAERIELEGRIERAVLAAAHEDKALVIQKTAKFIDKQVEKAVAALVPPPPPPDAMKSIAMGTPPKPEPVPGLRRKIPIQDRYPLWRRIASMHDIEELGFDEIARRLAEEGVVKGSGRPMDTPYVRLAYSSFHSHREMLKIPRTNRLAVPPTPMPMTEDLFEVPDYLRGMLSDESLSSEKRLGVLRALHPGLPASVELMLEDEKLSTQTKLRILGVVINEEKP